MMPNTVIFALLMEVFLIALTSFILLRKNGFFGSVQAKRKAMAFWSAFLGLLFTFAWSVVTGVVLGMNNLYLRLL